MKIEKSTSGGVIIKNEDGSIRNIIKSENAYLHLHPRNADAILINNQATEQDEVNSIVINAATVTEIDGAAFAGNRNDLLIALDPLFNVGGDVGEGAQSAASKNKTYVQTFKTTKNFGNGDASLLNLFPEVTIQAGKQVRLDVRIPTRSESTNWGGLYVNVNAKVNGVWYNLGNTGHDGGVMHYSATSIHALNHQMILDFIGNLGLDENQEYTLQFELTARSYNYTTIVNGSHDINGTGFLLGSRGELQTWASDQNFTHLIITEIDRQ